MQKRGLVIPAAPLTGASNPIGPARVTAQVTEHVYDTSAGKFLPIPQGPRLIGSYDSQAAFENMGY
jgi:type IV secretion system protein TrbI